jgi:hypothetical protein
MRDLLETARLEEPINGPNKAGVLWLRLKSAKQTEKVMHILRNEFSDGKDMVFLPNPDDLPSFHMPPCILRWHDPTDRILEIECYNLKAFNAFVGFHYLNPTTMQRYTHNDRIANVRGAWLNTNLDEHGGLETITENVQALCYEWGFYLINKTIPPA